MIDALVVFTEGGDSHPFTAAKDDPLTADIYQTMMATGRVAAYVAPVLTAAQLAAQALAGGLALKCASNSALNGTYTCTPDDISSVQAQFISILDGGVFTNGQPTRTWPDAQGDPHEFNIQQFRAFGRAMAVFVDACKTIITANSGTPPSNQVAIP